MTRARRNARRTGFTLVELLVGMSIILALAGLTLLVYPGARDQDRVRQTVSEVGAHLKLAQGMAARDKAPRGVRFVVANDPTNIDKTDVRWVTELQYIEQPLPLIPNRTPGTAATAAELAAQARVAFRYTVAPAPPPGPTAGARQGAITGRECVIENLLPEEAGQIVPGCTLVMPVLGAWSKVTAVAPTPVSYAPAPAPGKTHRVVTLEVYPDAVMGASTHAVTYHFAIYLPPTPLVGEPTILLPKNICVDLNVSVPSLAGVAAPTHFDVLFGPDGRLVNSPNGQLFLWVRDYTKPAPYGVVAGPPRTAPFLTNTTTPTLADAFRRGGEQYILAIRSSGTIGQNEVALPDATGTYATPLAAYALAQQELRQ